MIAFVLTTLFSFAFGTFLSYFLTTKIICADKPNDTACGFVLYILTPILIIFSFLVGWLLLKIFKIKLFQSGKQMLFSLIVLVILIAIFTLNENASTSIYSTLYNKVGLFKSNSTFQTSPNISQKEDQNQRYLSKIRRYVVEHNLKISLADPAKYDVLRTEAGEYRGKTIIIVYLNCCFTGDKAYLDRETEEVVGFQLGDR